MMADGVVIKGSLVIDDLFCCCGDFGLVKGDGVTSLSLLLSIKVAAAAESKVIV